MESAGPPVRERRLLRLLVFHEEAHNGISSRKETGVGIAIGDISGKGISAALLMATLHSAVRAYRLPARS